MLKFLNKDPRLSHTQSIIMTYPRTVKITFGNYPYVEDIHNFIIDIKKNLSDEESFSTNVKGHKTKWTTFNTHPLTTKFINYCINKHQGSSPELFEYFYEKQTIVECWGNEIRKGEYVRNHSHPCYHGILYLTEGEPLILPELNIKIIPEPGNYYFFPPYILHYVNESTHEKYRYNIIMNIHETPNWKKDKQIYLKEKENNE